MKEIFLKELNRYQIVVYQFNYVGVFDTLEEGRNEVAKLFKNK